MRNHPNADIWNGRCPGSHRTPAALFRIRYRFALAAHSEILGECSHCAHAFSINNNRQIRAHEFHGCFDGIFVPECPRGQTAHHSSYEVEAELRLDEKPEIAEGGVASDA